MTKSQNTKNEQQKDLCITSEQLTEQWKKGEFIICNAGKCQYYYVQNEEQREVIKTEYCLFDDNTPNWKILAPVPSYEEWQASEKYNKHLEEVIKIYERKDKQATETSIAYNKLAEENKELKEQINHLLKTQARQFVDNQKLQVKAEKAKDVVNIDTARQIKQLKELLEECKEVIKNVDTYYGNYDSTNGYLVINKIDEVLK